MAFKQNVYEHCRALLQEKINSLKTILSELESGSENDSKSSAGDKHETSRAMMQLEQEKINKQLGDALLQKIELEKMGLYACAEVKRGSLVKTNGGYLYFAIPLGKITVDGISIMVLSVDSPLGIKMRAHKKGDKVKYHNAPFLIEEIE